jgi:L-threonylcarbamoyladenylate synthase
MPPERIASGALDGPDGPALLLAIASRIREGAVFIYPTETIYGIGGRHDVPDVYTKIVSAKVRAPDNPMILIGGSIECFALLDIEFPDAAQRLADAFWPGLLTLVLPSPSVDGGIAVRVSDHPFLTALSGYFPQPLYSTSANISGEPYCPDPDAIFAALGHRVDFMIDAGVLPSSLPSTVVRVTSDNRVTVLREGCIAPAAIGAAAA